MLVVRSLVVGPFSMNAYLLACGETGEAVLVDPGAEVPRLLAMAEPGWRIGRIFLTHGHVDHVAGAARARAATSARLSIHAADEDWLRSLPRQAEMYGFEGAEVPTVDIRHADGDELALGRHTGHVLHTPGHSAGSCSLWFPEDDILLTGDTLFSGSVGRTDLPGGDFDTLSVSIREKLFPLGDEVTFHPGHGPAGHLGEERRLNPFVGESPPGRGLHS
jgi:glyoxylase-like metal-dependent hydrolase (beta-lactamase superfamily II)